MKLQLFVDWQKSIGSYPSSSLNFASDVMLELSTNIFLAGNTELLQQSGSWIDTSSIKEICFVFSYIDVIDGKFCCEGISNAYYIRYRYISETLSVEAISSKVHPHFAFPSLYPTFHSLWTTCFSTEMWETTVLIQQAITGLFCHYAQSQGLHPTGWCRENVTFPVMSYLSSWLQSRNVFGYNIACSQMQKHVRSGIIYSKVKHLVKGFCWHFDKKKKTYFESVVRKECISWDLCTSTKAWGVVQCCPK